MASNSKNRTNSKDILMEKAAEMLANPEVKTNKEIYESLDIPKSTFYDWKDRQEFIDMVNEKVDKYTDQALPDVWESLIEQATSGSVQAQKLYFEMKDKYRDRKEISGPDGGAIETKQEYDLSNLSDEELDLMHEIQNKITPEGRNS